MNQRIVIAIFLIATLSALVYFDYDIFPSAPRSSDPDYDEELEITFKFQEINDFILLIPIIYSGLDISHSYYDLTERYNNASDDIQIRLISVNGTNYLEFNGSNRSNYKVYSYLVHDEFADPHVDAFESTPIYLESLSGENGSLSISLEAQNEKYQGLSGCRYYYDIYTNVEVSTGWNLYPPNELFTQACA